MPPKNVGHVAAWRLCLGCGACAYGCPENKIRLVDFVNDGIRPVILDGCGRCGECVRFCPGYETSHAGVAPEAGASPGLMKGWGTVLEIWQGYAADPELRFSGSSGGAASALALYCIEEEDMGGALHTGACVDDPWRNRTVLSRCREELLARTGSRYSPASPCDGLSLMETSASPCVFIGKPCDVAGLRKAQGLRPGLNGKTGLAISIFCAGTPSSRGTLELLRNFRIEPGEVSGVRYRGMGWPGSFSVSVKEKNVPSFKASYEEVWGFLQRFRPLRCHLCPDGTGELADISCGDPWHMERKPWDRGHSMIVVRTERGRRVIRAAIKAGYLHLERAGPGILERSQGNLLEKRRNIWGRLLVFRLLMIPHPRLRDFSLLENWLDLKFAGKINSILGTAKRMMLRGYFRRLKHLFNL